MRHIIRYSTKRLEDKGYIKNIENFFEKYGNVMNTSRVNVLCELLKVCIWDTREQRYENDEETCQKVFDEFLETKGIMFGLQYMLEGLRREQLNDKRVMISSFELRPSIGVCLRNIDDTLQIDGAKTEEDLIRILKKIFSNMVYDSKNDQYIPSQLGEEFCNTYIEIFGKAKFIESCKISLGYIATVMANDGKPISLEQVTEALMLNEDWEEDDLDEL